MRGRRNDKPIQYRNVIDDTGQKFYDYRPLDWKLDTLLESFTSILFHTVNFFVKSAEVKNNV